MMADDDWRAARREIETSGRSINPVGPISLLKKNILKTLLAAFGMGLRLTSLHARGERNALDLQLRHHDIVLPCLPAAFDGYRLLHVSDSHFDLLPALVESTRRLLTGLEVNLLVFTGDALGEGQERVGYAADLLAQSLEGVTACDGRLAILGNHDPVEMVGALQRVGFDVLVNRGVEIRRGGERLRLLGLDDVHYFYTPRTLAMFDDKVEGCAIALVHSAELADHAARAGYSLYLAGHTHGGQIALPGGRPILTQLKRCWHGAVGIWREGDMIGHTSAGLGVSLPTVRFNTRGEATVITLRRAGAESA